MSTTTADNAVVSVASATPQTDLLANLKSYKIWFPYTDCDSLLVHNAATGYITSSKETDHAVTYADAWIAQKRYNLNGVGISLTIANEEYKLGVCVVDCDSCSFAKEQLDFENDVDRFIWWIIRVCDTYTERSRSLTGFHLVFCGLKHLSKVAALSNINFEPEAAFRQYQKVHELKPMRSGFTPITFDVIDKEKYQNPYRDENFNMLVGRIRFLQGQGHFVKKKVSRGNYDDAFIGRVLLHLPEEWVHSRQDWIYVGIALHSLGDAYFKYWAEWSKGTAEHPYNNYSDDKCLEAWQSFKSDGRLGFGSLIYHAIQNGMNFDEADDSSLKSSRGRTDYANAKRVFQSYGEGLRYIPEWGVFICWDGQRWVLDSRESTRVRGLVQARMEEMEKEWRNYCFIKEGDDKEEQLVKLAITRFLERSLNSASHDATIKELKGFPELTLSYKRLEANPYLFNFSNGTLDIERMEFRDFSRLDYLLNISALPYVKEQAPSLEKWYKVVSGCIKSEIRSYAEEIFALALIGRQLEQNIVILVGAGENGKSTLVYILCQLFGDYGVTLNKNVLLGKASHPTELTVLHGKHFAISNEVEGQFDTNTLKAITGGDVITARRCAEDPWTFEPTHNLYLVCNTLPNVRDNSHGFWRRIKVIRADNITFNKDTANKSLRWDCLLDDEFKRAASYSLVAALRRYIERGKKLDTPKDVETDTNKYRDACDTLKLFVDACCDVKEEFYVPTKELYRLYLVWCIVNDVRYERSSRSFSDLCERHGYGTPKNADGKGRVSGQDVCIGGLKLKEPYSAITKNMLRDKKEEIIKGLSISRAELLLGGYNIFVHYQEREDAKKIDVDKEEF